MIPYLSGPVVILSTLSSSFKATMVLQPRLQKPRVHVTTGMARWTSLSLLKGHGRRAKSQILQLFSGEDDVMLSRRESRMLQLVEKIGNTSVDVYKHAIFFVENPKGSNPNTPFPQFCQCMAMVKPILFLYIYTIQLDFCHSNALSKRKVTSTINLIKISCFDPLPLRQRIKTFNFNQIASTIYFVYVFIRFLISLFISSARHQFTANGKQSCNISSDIKKKCLLPEMIFIHVACIQITNVLSQADLDLVTMTHSAGLHCNLIQIVKLRTIIYHYVNDKRYHIPCLTLFKIN